MLGFLKCIVVFVIVLLALDCAKGKTWCRNVCSKGFKANVTIPFNGIDVLNRTFYESEIFGKYTYGLIDWMKISGSKMLLHYDLKMKIYRNASGVVRRTLFFATHPNNQSTCLVRYGTNAVYQNSSLAIDKILRDPPFDDSAKNNLEIHFTSHPDKYLLSLVCPSYQEEIHKGTCPVENFVLMLKVYRPPRDTALDDFSEEIQLAEEDIKRNMDNIFFCKYENMKIVYLFGDTSKCWERSPGEE